MLDAVQRLISLQKRGKKAPRYGLGSNDLQFLRKYWPPTSIRGSIGHENEEEWPHHGSPPNKEAKVLYKTEGDNESDDVDYDEPYIGVGNRG